jgi:uncharacterized protein YoxC
MSDESEEKRLSVEAVMQSMADLRFSVSQFQNSIEDFLVSVEETWREVKSSLASIEARLAGMEVRVSTLPIDAEINLEEMNAMRDDLAAIGKEVAKMRQRFHSFAEATLVRVN